MELYKPELIIYLEEFKDYYYLHDRNTNLPISHIPLNPITFIKKKHLHKIYRKEFLGTKFTINFSKRIS